MKRMGMVGVVVAGLCLAAGSCDGQGRAGEAVKPAGVAGRPAEVRVREVADPGMWFPADRGALADMVDGFLKNVPEEEATVPGRPVAVVSPHAGYRYSGQVAAYAYKALAKARPKRVILLGPSHYMGFRGAMILDVDVYRTPLGDVALDREACEGLLKNPLVSLGEEKPAKEHSLQNQVPFLQRTVGEFKLIPLMVGNLEGDDYEKLGASLRGLMDDGTVMVVSSDFTHYGQRQFGYAPFTENLKENIRKVDMGAAERIAAMDFAGFRDYAKGTTICGRGPIGVMLKTLEGQKEVEGKLLKYANSGDATGQYDGSVSYAAMVIYRKGEKTVTGQEKYLSKEEEQTLLKLARETLRTYLREGKEPEATKGGYDLTEKLKAKGAAFVTLTKRGELRGCIGHVVGIEPLYSSVMSNAVSAATGDPRFAPMTAEEEKEVHIEISVMSPLRTIKDVNEIRVGRDGIIISKGHNRGLLLPQVATEYGWTRLEFLEQTCRKAGLPRDAWKEGSTIQIFSAQVFGE